MFSVICPVFNKEKELKETIDSVLSQAYKDFELILIENGSTDNSLSVIQSFNDPRIKLIQTNQIGPGAARNIGVAHAKNDWIAFLDADDLWENFHLQNIFEAISKQPNVNFFSSSWKVLKSNTFSPSTLATSINEKRIFFSEKRVLELTLQNSPPFWTSAIVVHKKLFNQAGGFPESLPAHGEDVALWVQLIRLQKGIHFINDLSASYRADSSNMISKEFKVSFPGHIFSSVNLILEKVQDPELAILWKRFANKYQFSSLSKSIISGRFEKRNLKYLFPETDLKTKIVQILLRNNLLRGIFKSYLMKNQRFHG